MNLKYFISTITIINLNMVRIFKTAFFVIFIVSSDAHRYKRPNPDFASLTKVNSGTAATQGEFPWIVGFTASTVLFCSGSLIDANWVLTAAQCVPTPFTTYDVTLGCSNSAVSELERVIVKTSQAIVHPNFKAATLTNDIALLKLETSATISAYVKPIRLPRATDSSNLLVAAKATISGWGYNRCAIYHRRKVTERTVGNTLNWISTNIISNTDCQSKLSFKSITRHNIICTFIPGKTTCIGDVGGPLVHTEEDYLPTLIGVTSFVNKSCPINAAMTHTQVTSVLSWITSTSGIAERI